MSFQSKYLRAPLRRKWVRVLLIAAGLFACWWLAMLCIVPARLFDVSYATLVYSREGELMGARIAPDGQWRFPAADSLPDKFVTCLTTFEDHRFFRHPGIDPVAIARAVRSNIRSGNVVSGGSTLTMQLARVARGNRDRNIYEKIVEMNWALFLETRYSKREILNIYASHAPFGGNVVGVETASWRYFGRSSFDLSWAESATLAVLPNSPALIHPGRNREQLKTKRDALLARLRDRGIIDQTAFELACMEPLPEAPVALPDYAPHLTERLALWHQGTRITASVRSDLQKQVQALADRYAARYASNHVYNIAAIVADTETGEVLAYVGNVSFKGNERRGNNVDIITSQRSTGSVLKPILYAGMLNDGLILPRTLVRDTPLNINGYIPENYDKTYYGAVHADRAIAKSLNVPLVRMLSEYNTGRFMSLLKKYGMTTLHFSEDHYGAAIILGGAEGKLWDIVGMYASMSRTLNHFRPYSGRYNLRDIHPLHLQAVESEAPITNPADKRLTDEPLLSAAALWHTFEAMSEVNRPEEEADWQQFSSMKRVAWKTGTSYGGRDAWAIGTTPRYSVGVWVGNSAGEGRAGVTGVGYAAPVLFDIFSLLPSGGWFEMPLDEMERMPICRQSGHKASEICETVDTLYVPRAGAGTEMCPYHRLVHLSADGTHRVNSSCEDVSKMQTVSWFVLPPAMEFYFRHHNVDYHPLPPVKAGCGEEYGRAQIDIIYPEHNAMLYLPKGLSGEFERFIFKAAHARPDATIYWYVDQEYIGHTEGRHTIECGVASGTHTLTLTDDRGNQRKILFEARSRE